MLCLAAWTIAFRHVISRPSKGIRFIAAAALVLQRRFLQSDGLG
jgi:hypothetical protein